MAAATKRSMLTRDRMIYISEEESAALVTHELAFEAARLALVAAASQQSGVFPAVLGRTREASNTFSIKSGWSDDLTGVKIGSFWAGNPARGLPRHNSTIVLLDQLTGRLGAVIEAGRVNAYRTAAADAVAADLLAREQAKVLAIFGAGNQAGFEVMALARIRPVEEVLVVARPSPRRDAFVGRITGWGLKARDVSAEEAVRAADIVVTATPSREPLFRADWVVPEHMSSAWDRTRRASGNCRATCSRGQACSATCPPSPSRSVSSSTCATR
jgi:ornithine cyclodeaminase